MKFARRLVVLNLLMPWRLPTWHERLIGINCQLLLVVGLANIFLPYSLLLSGCLVVLCVTIAGLTFVGQWRAGREIKRHKVDIKLIDEVLRGKRAVADLPPEIQEDAMAIRARRILKAKDQA